MIIEEEIKIIGIDKGQVNKSTIDYLLKNHKAYQDMNMSMGEDLVQIENAYDSIRVKKFHQTKMGIDKYMEMRLTKHEITSLYALAASRKASYVRFVNA